MYLLFYVLLTHWVEVFIVFTLLKQLISPVFMLILRVSLICWSGG